MKTKTFAFFLLRMTHHYNMYFFRNTRCSSVLKLYSRTQMDQVKLFAVVELSAKGSQEIAVVPYCWVRELHPNINICITLKVPYQFFFSNKPSTLLSLASLDDAI